MTPLTVLTVHVADSEQVVLRRATPADLTAIVDLIAADQG